jgi:hypothetical protein
MIYKPNIEYTNPIRLEEIVYLINSECSNTNVKNNIEYNVKSIKSAIESIPARCLRILNGYIPIIIHYQARDFPQVNSIVIGHGFSMQGLQSTHNNPNNYDISSKSNLRKVVFPEQALLIDDKILESHNILNDYGAFIINSNKFFITAYEFDLEKIPTQKLF